ncbi:MAG: 2-hydroxyacid dehydrogenase [Lentisphaeria bacterium]
MQIVVFNCGVFNQVSHKMPVDCRYYEEVATSDNLHLASDADIIVSNDFTVDAKVLDKLPKLKLICLLGSGYDLINHSELRKRNIQLCNTPNYGVENVAQVCLAMILDAACDLGIKSRLDWSHIHGKNCRPIFELYGSRVGFLGYGRVAKRVQEMLAPFNCTFYSYSARGAEDLENEGVCKVSLEQLCKECDVISVHARSTDENHGILGKEMFDLMSGSIVVNTARGRIINEGALLEALESGRVLRAALDVREQEPPVDDKLLHPHCLTTPHIACRSDKAYKRMVDEVLLNISQFLESGQSGNLVTIV